MNRPVDFARFWRSLSTPLRIWITAVVALISATTCVAVYHLVTPSDPVPACVQAEAAGRSDTFGEQSWCMEQANAWCARHYSDADNGLCLDKIYGVVPSDYDGSGDPLDAQH